MKRILQTSHQPAAAAMTETLATSPRKGVMRLLLSFLDDPHAPLAALAVIGGRSDVEFIHYLLRKIGHEPAPVVAQNLKRIESVAWLHGDDRVWEAWDDAAQHALVRLVMASGIPRLQVFATIESVLLHGKAAGRREAARAWPNFTVPRPMPWPWQP